MLAQESRHKFSVKEYIALFERRVVSEAMKAELLNGEIVELSPIGFRHARTQQLLQNYLCSVYSPNNVFQNGSIIADNYNMPEPDVYVLKPGSMVENNYPTASQLALVVEVADTTIQTDFLNDGTGKLGIYATANIPMVWVVDVKSLKLYEFSNAEAALYKNLRIHTGVAKLCGKTIAVNDLIAT